MERRWRCSAYWACLPVAVAFLGLLVDQGVDPSGTAGTAVTALGLPFVALLIAIVAALAREEETVDADS